MTRISTRFTSGSYNRPSSPDFGKIERQVRKFRRFDGFVIAPKVREEFEVALENYCRAIHLANGAPKAADVSSLTRRLEKWAAAGQPIIHDLSGLEQTAAASFLTKHEMPDLQDLACKLAWIEASCHRAQKDLARQSRRGPERDDAFAEFVCRLAIIYQREYDTPTTSWNKKGARDTPFLTIVRELHRCAPVATQPPTAIKERTHREIRAWKKRVKITVD